MLSLMRNEGQAERRPLLEWLLGRHPDTPKTRAKQWILAGRVSVGGMVMRKPHEAIPDPGKQLVLLERHATSLDCGSGWFIHPRVTLLHLDTALAVLNKGAGLISVPAPNCELSALSILADFLAGKLRPRDRALASRTLPPAYRRLHPLPVHRLDQFTTGVFCAAMNPSARHHLIEQLKAHTMRREYVAFVEGRSPASEGTWRHWLELSEDEFHQRIVGQGGAKVSRPEAKEAITHFQVVAEYPLAKGKAVISQLRLRLETGRKHQIRIQAAQVGLPLIGDRTYHPKYREDATVLPLIEFPRQALHAEKLSLEHPEAPRQRMTWRAEWPKDLRQLEAALRAGAF